MIGPSSAAPFSVRSRHARRRRPASSPRSQTPATPTPPTTRRGSPAARCCVTTTFDKYLTRRANRPRTGRERRSPTASQKIVIHCAEPDKARTRRSLAARRGQRRVPRARPRQRAGQRAGTGRVRRPRQGTGEVGRRSRDPRRRADRTLKMGCAARPWRREACVRARVASCSGTAPNRSAPSRSASSARASSSIRAASRSSPRPAWRT